MQSFKVPNEILVRLHDPAGPGTPVAIKGAHVTFNIFTYEDDGTFVSAAQGPPESIAVGAQKGFPLQEILGTALQSALLGRETDVAEIEQMKSARDTALSDKQQAEAEAAKHEHAREKMREAMGGKITDLQRALAEEEAAKLARADIAVKGT